MPGTAAACLTAAQSLLQCQSNGPAGWMGPWTQPNLDSLQWSPCCSIDVKSACGTPENFFQLWQQDSSLFSLSSSKTLFNYMGGSCSASTLVPTRRSKNLVVRGGFSVAVVVLLDRVAPLPATKLHCSLCMSATYVRRGLAT